MAYNVGLKVGVEGNAEFKRTVREINDELKTMDSALRLVESSYNGQMNSMDALKAKGEALQGVYDKQSGLVKELSAALQNAQRSETQYASKADEVRNKLSAAQSEMERLKNSTNDTSAEQKKLAAEISGLTKELKSAEQGQAASTRAVNDWQRQVNNATVKLNNLEGELKDNKRYMAEAEKATDKCATSIDKYGKKTKDAAESTEEAKEQGGLLSKIFAGGLMANIATQAINMVVSALKKLASAAVEAADEFNRLNAQTGVSITKLQEMQYVVTALDGNLDTLQKAQAKLTRSMDDARRGSTEYADAFSRLKIEYKNADGTLRDANEVMYDAFDALGKIGSEADRDAIALRLFGRSAMELNPLIKAGSEEIRRLSDEAHNMGAVMFEDTVKKLDKAHDRMATSWLGLKARVGEATAGILDFVSKLITGHEYGAGQVELNVESMQDKVDGLKDAYDSAYHSAKESLEKQMGLWDDMSQAAAKSYGEVKNAVYTQIQWLEDYSTNLANLSARNVEGIDVLIDKLADGSTQSASILAGLATASDTELRSLIDRMSEVDDRQAGLSRQIAQIKTDTNGQLNELYAGVQKTAEQLDASAVAKQAARDTMQGYIGEIGKWTDDVAKVFRGTAKAANEAYRDELKIKSPSRVAMAATEDYFDGHIIKAKQMTAEMETAYSEPARKADLAYRAALPTVIQEPTRQEPDMGQNISRSISEALGGSVKKSIDLTFNITQEIDGRQIATSTHNYHIEEDMLAGENLIN